MFDETKAVKARKEKKKMRMMMMEYSTLITHSHVEGGKQSIEKKINPFIF